MEAREQFLDGDDLAACLRVLGRVAAERGALAALDEATRRELLTLAGRVAWPERAARKRLAKAFRRGDRLAARAHDALVVEAARNRAGRRAPGHVLPASTARETAAAAVSARELLEARDCYVCKQPFRRVHHFYESLCPACAELNWTKRSQTAPLDGRVALVTGARIKIGFQAALKLLRAGARVVATSRFPVDAARRFAAEPDFAAFRARLELHGLDLRDLAAVERFARALAASLPRLDVLVNNAAQTVRRPPAYYAELAAAETDLPRELQPLLAPSPPLTELAPRRASPSLALLPVAPDDASWGAAHFPPGARDLDLQQVDLRDVNSWRLRLGEVSTAELVEAALVNQLAPFILARELRPLLARDRTDEKHVVNVSAMEASFARRKKTDKHPHTNMAKAALNMMTRTSAADFAEDGIWMNSVDTGWITDEDPLAEAARKQAVHDFHPPLDAVDGAARVLDPLFDGVRTGRHPCGLFFKDYRAVEW